MQPFAIAITVLFWLSLLGLGVGGLRRVALWRVGRAAPVRWRDLLAVPKRYFVDLHRVVARDPIMRTWRGRAAVAAMALVVNYGLALAFRPWICHRRGGAGDAGRPAVRLASASPRAYGR